MERETPPPDDFSETRYSPLKTTNDVQLAVDEATSQPQAILFIHVDWAPMHDQRRRFAEFRREFKSRYPNSDLAFRYIDCTAITEGYGPLRSIPGWKQLEKLNNGTSLLHGYGELAWCKNGRVLRVAPILDIDSTAALIARTQSLGMGINAD